VATLLVCLSKCLDANTAITGAVQRKGGTNAAEALKESRKMFLTFPRQAERIVLLLTDGDVGNAKEISRLMFSQDNIYVMVIGVGIGYSSNVAAVGNKTLFIKDFEELQSVFDNLACKGHAPPSVSLRSRGSTSASFELAFLEPYEKFEVQVFKENGNSWSRGEITTGRVCHVHNLEPGTTYQVRARAFPRGRAPTIWSNEEEGAKELRFRTIYAHADARNVKDSKLSEKVVSLADHLDKYEIPSLWKSQGVRSYNILLMGRMGNGKSSYLNTANSSLKGGWQQINVAKNDIKTVTLNIGKFAVNQRKTLQIWDTYGWSESNYTKEFDFLLGGNLRDGYKEGAEITSDFYNPSPAVGDRVHSVIIVCTASSVNTISEMERLSSFFQRITEKGINPLVILTKMDTLPDAELEGQYQNIYDVGVIDQAIETFCKHTKIERSFVFPVINYTGPTTRNFVIEWLCLNVFQKAINQVEANLKREFRFCAQILDVQSGESISTVDLRSHEATLDWVRSQYGAKIRAAVGDFRFVENGKEISTADEPTTFASSIRESIRDSDTLWIKGVRAAATNNQLSTTSSVTQKLKVSVVTKEDKSLGFIPSVEPSLPLSEFRELMVAELEDELPTSFQFLSATQLPFNSFHENTTPVAEILLQTGDRYCVYVNFEKWQRLSIMSENGKRYGQIRMEMDGSTKIAAIRDMIVEEELEVPDPFKFLTADGDPLTKRQEQTALLGECKRILEGKEGLYTALFIQ